VDVQRHSEDCKVTFFGQGCNCHLSRIQDLENGLADTIGEVVETLRNLIAASKMDLAPEQHLDYIRAKMIDMQAKLRRALLDSGHEDHWAD